jgi:glycosyltransferase involved in cell wall biosynthesis
LIVCQLQNTAHGMDAYTVELLRYNSPRAVMVNVNGDYWRDRYLSDEMLAINRLFNLVGCTNAAVVPELCQRGVCAFYLPMSFEPTDGVPDAPSHDIVFLGNGYGKTRHRLGALLRELPHNSGIYGKFPNIETDGDTHYDFAAGRGIYSHAQLAVSTMQFDDARGFVSNRLWEALAAGGAAVLQQHAPGLDEMTGLQAGVHYIEWHDLDELPGLIDEWLSRTDERRQIADAAYRFVHAHHSYDVRADRVLEEIRRVK